MARFGEIVVRAELHRLERCLHRRVAGHHQDFRRLFQLAKFAQNFQPAAPRHHNVEQGDVELTFGCRLDGSLSIVHQRNLVPDPGQLLLKNQTEILFVLGN